MKEIHLEANLVKRGKGWFIESNNLNSKTSFSIFVSKLLPHAKKFKAIIRIRKVEVLG
jgi:hypothetical protein